MVLLSEEEIEAGMAFALWEHRLVLEGAGAVGLAALLHQKIAPLGENIALVLSGGNVAIESLLEIAQQYSPGSFQ